MTVINIGTDEAPPAGPCPTCGRPDPRDGMARLRARTQLTTSLMREPGLTTAEICEAVAGTRSVTDVLAARDERVSNNAPHEEGDQQ